MTDNSGQAAYESLSPAIQRVLYDMGWTALRPLQVEAIRIISQTTSDLILSARTAAGKTEAAFLPILSQIDRAPTGSVGAIYVGPLRALINDQFRRLEGLCRRAEIPVHRWHGDVSATDKKRLVDRPGGVLLITPESLESLFLNRTERLPDLFHGLRHIVVDELHAMHGNERGMHLRSLLYRVEAYTAVRPRYVALSATIGDLKLTQRWVNADDPDSVRVVSDEADQKSIRYSVSAYLDEGQDDDVRPDEEHSPNASASGLNALSDDLYGWSSKGKNLIFANRKGDVEWYADELNSRAAVDGLGQHYRVHHGSLSREVREHTEKLMQSDKPRTTLCTSTLELGLDIGDVEAVGQIGCPFSVNSLVQRLGRSGRKDDQPHVMRVALIEEKLKPESDLERRLRPRLLQIIALTNLMLEKWTEPPLPSDGDLSTLVQQILSVIRQRGGATAAELMRLLGSNGAFRWMTPQLLSSVLRAIAGKDLIEQAPSGELILGLEGEAIVGRYDFYAAFATPEEYRVSQEGRLIGMLPAEILPQEGQRILLAGRRWKVAGVDHKRRELSVKPSRGRRPTKFAGDGGLVHRRVHEAMRAAIRSDATYVYLNPVAAGLLEEVRQVSRDCGLANSDFVQLSDSATQWFPWAGSRGLTTLWLILKRHRIEADIGEFSLVVPIPLGELRQMLVQISEESLSEQVLTELLPPLQRRKYDQYLSDDLLRYSCSRDLVCVDDAQYALRSHLRYGE